MPSVDHTLEMSADPAAIIAAFFDPVALSQWWHVERSVTTPRLLGVYAVEWPPTTFVDEVLGALGGVLYGTVVDYRPEREFLVAEAYWIPPESDPVGPMALHVSCVPAPGGQATRVRVLQTGGNDAPRWKRYYDVMGAGWTGSLAALKTYLETTSGPSPRRSFGMTELLRVLRLRDIILLNIVAVIGLRWIPRGARVGAPAMLLWVLAWLCFFVPLAVTVINLSKRYPEQGGLYVWVRRAFGPFHGAVCAWCLWVNNLFYFPALLLFAAANVAVVIAGFAPGLSENRSFSTVFVLGLLWVLVLLNIRGFAAGRWLQTWGAVGTWVPAGLVVVAGGVALALFGSATSFAPEALLPRDDLVSTLSLWSAFCFAFSGLEIGAFSSEEIEEPERTLPRGILIGGLAATVIYIVGTAAMLIAVPAESLVERSGIADAVDVVGSRVGLPATGALTAVLVAVGSIAGTSAWMASSARVSFAAGLDRLWPAFMARLHPRRRTPHVALLVQGVVSTGIFLTSLFLTLGGGRTTIQEAYDILVNLTVVIYFVPYLYLFMALVRLDRQADGGLPAGPHATRADTRWWRWGLAAVGFVSTAIAVGLAFVPPAGTTNTINYVVNLLLQTAVVMGAGIALFVISRRAH